MLHSDIQNEDAGKYRCEIHKGGNILDELTHTLQVYREYKTVDLCMSGSVANVCCIYIEKAGPHQIAHCDIIMMWSLSKSKAN